MRKGLIDTMADQAKLQVILGDMMELLKTGKLQEHSVDILIRMKDKKQYAEALNLVEKFGCSTAFIDHDSLCTLLAQGWLIYCDVLTLEGKNMKKKLAKLEEDKKTEADVLAKFQGQMEDFYVRKTLATSTASKYKYMNMFSIEKFSDTGFDAMKQMKDDAGAQ